MRRAFGVGPILFLAVLAAVAQNAVTTDKAITGFRNPAAELVRERQLLAVPDPERAEQHLKVLTAAPHVAGTTEDRATADYVAAQFRAAGLETEIVEYRIWINYPAEIAVDVTAPPTVKMHGPRREQVEGDPYQDDPRVMPAFNGLSPSGDVEAEVVYANYGRPEDLAQLKALGVDVRGKILLIRYGSNFRGVKAFVAEENGAAGVLLYSDPADDGWVKGDIYPKGPWRPASGVQRGSVGYTFHFPGDPTTPGIASLPDLPAGQRLDPARSTALSKVPTTPLSYADASPILENLGGPVSPREWQGALPFTYHVGAGPARVRMHLKQDYKLRPIWNVIGRIRGSQWPAEWVIAGNHRDAWEYGAADPGSGTAAMLEAVRGFGALLKTGWRPKRTIVFGSWDAEEQGLMGSTEWAEQHEAELASAVAYFNVDVAVTGPNFSVAAVPSLKPFVREVAQSVPGAKGGSIYEAWLASQQSAEAQRTAAAIPATDRKPAVSSSGAAVGDLGAGSDYVAFLQHFGVPATDFTSHGPYGVYHSVFDNFAWFKKFADPLFLYEQQQARFMALETMRMAEADVLPLDYEEYGHEIKSYLLAAQSKAQSRLTGMSLNFAPALAASDRLLKAGTQIKSAEAESREAQARLNRALRQAESAFLLPDGLPNRPWFKHAIYAPGEYTGYAAVVLPGVNEALDARDAARAEKQLRALTGALERAAQTLEGYK